MCVLWVQFGVKKVAKYRSKGKKKMRPYATYLVNNICEKN